MDYENEMMQSFGFFITDAMMLRNVSDDIATLEFYDLYFLFFKILFPI